MTLFHSRAAGSQPPHLRQRYFPAACVVPQAPHRFAAMSLASGIRETFRDGFGKTSPHLLHLYASPRFLVAHWRHVLSRTTGSSSVSSLRGGSAAGSAGSGSAPVRAISAATTLRSSRSKLRNTRPAVSGVAHLYASGSLTRAFCRSSRTSRANGLGRSPSRASLRAPHAPLDANGPRRSTWSWPHAVAAKARHANQAPRPQATEEKPPFAAQAIES